MNQDALELRIARPEDAAALLEIYSPYVKETAITFDYQVPSQEEFQEKIRKTLENYPFLVGLRQGKIIGYAYAGVYYGKEAYKWMVETTIYLDQGARGKGDGQAFYEALENILKEMGILSLVACITDPNPASINLHKKLGFEKIGHFKSAGYKLGQWFDTIWMEKQIGDYQVPPQDVMTFKEWASMPENVTPRFQQ